MRTLGVGLMMAILPLLAGCISAPVTPGLTEALDATRQDLTPPPDAPIPAIIKGLLPVAKADVPTGAGIAVYGHYGYVPAREAGFYVVDLMDPEKPVVVSNMSATKEFYVRFLNVLDLDGRIIVVGAGQSTGMHFLDVTDPAAPQLLSTLMMEDNQQVHNVVTVPGTTLVYNTPSSGVNGVNHIVDAKDPEDPKIVGKFGDHGCHLTDVRVDLQRAYCAGVQETQIWDIKDPLHPELIVRIDNPIIANNDVRFPALPGGSPVSYPFRLYGLHHQALPSADGKLLMISDEWSGGGTPGACFANVENPATGSASTPFGAVWFFDVSEEKSPKFLTWFTPPAVTKTTEPTTNPPKPPLPVNCTAHIGTLVPDHPDLVLWAWYNSGVVLVDIKDPMKPTMVTRWNEGTNTWDVEVYHGWIITGDIARGLDVLKFV